MANLVAHGLLALAVHSGLWGVLTGEPLTAYAFLCALSALLSDLEVGMHHGRSPVGHSLGYAMLYVLIAGALLLGLATAGVLPLGSVVPISVAVGLGLASHLLLDALVGPGIWGLPRPSGWSRIRFGKREGSFGRIELGVSTLSASVLLLVVVLT